MPLPERHAPGILTQKPYALRSHEHAAPLEATLVYVPDMESDGLVRVFDGQIAARDGAFCVARESLTGLTPVQIRDLFSLSYTPRFICAARVPPGARIALCALTNGDGKRVKVYQALDHLELGDARELLP